MPLVISRIVREYEYPLVKGVVFSMLDRLGGQSIRKGWTVLIKPNLLGPAAPDAAMITHPLIVRAAVEYALQRGGVVRVADSPALGAFRTILETGGFIRALTGLDVILKEFDESETVAVGDPFKKIEVARGALHADFIINLPKLKSHAQMLLTLGVKNMYGCIVGLRKPEWHFRTGVNRSLFAKLLVQTCRVVHPSVTILDGVLAMEGQGPGRGGSPRQTGVMMGSADPVALDMAVCRMLGIDPFMLPTNRAAHDMGVVGSGPEIDGEMPSVTDFRFPEITPLVFGPRPLHGVMRRHLVQRPVCSHADCRRCGECWRYCPAKAIELRNRRLHFDYDKCIRCYCCLEVCPYGALHAEEPMLGRLVKGVMRRGESGKV